MPLQLDDICIISRQPWREADRVMSQQEFHGVVGQKVRITRINNAYSPPHPTRYSYCGVDAFKYYDQHMPPGWHGTPIPEVYFDVITRAPATVNQQQERIWKLIQDSSKP